MIQTKVPKVIIPIPPNCKTKANINVPVTLNVSAVEMTAKPVTLTALTAVNKASIKLTSTPGLWAIGKLNKIVAIITAER